MELSLGTVASGAALRLTDEERSRHIHVLGASGTGKSKLLEAMIRQDILRGRGVCLLDPHGRLADAVLAWCAAVGLADRRAVHVIDLTDDTWSAGFNPLRVLPGQDIEPRVDAMVATCAEVWGGEDLDHLPLLGTCLQLLFYALAANNLTLAEAMELSATVEGRGLRSRLTDELPNPVQRSYWREFNALTKREFEERFSSTRRRLLRFLGAPTIRRMVGQSANVLNLRSIMDGSEILIVNLAPKGANSPDNARLLGALLMGELRLAAMSRDEETAIARPFNLYVDECYDYLTGDVERMLDETRKFGLHVVLSHQRLMQLRSRSDAIYNGVMAGGQTKIVFGGMTDDDAELMAREVFRSTFNLERPKHVLDKPVVVDEVPFWLETESETQTIGRAHSSSELSGWSLAGGSSESLSGSFLPEEEDPYSLSQSYGVSQSSGASGGTSIGSSETFGRGSTTGRSQTLKPVRVTMPTAVYSLEEELHLAIVKLRELPNQAAIVKRRGKPPVRFEPETVKQALAWPSLTAQFVASCRTRSPFLSASTQADTEIETRLVGLLGKSRAGDTSETAFWAE